LTTIFFVVFFFLFLVPRAEGAGFVVLGIRVGVEYVTKITVVGLNFVKGVEGEMFLNFSSACAPWAALHRQ